MFRYLTFVWNTADQPAADTARELAERLDTNDEKWLCAMVHPGIVVRYQISPTDAGKAYLAPRKDGVVLGTLFQRLADATSLPVDPLLSELEARAIVSSRGRRLVESYWGRYAAFIHDHPTGTSWVLCDPTGGMPCFCCSARGVTIYFMDLEDVVQIGIRPLTINTDYLEWALCFPTGLQTHETALREVGQVLGGERVEWRSGHATRSFLWDPFAIVRETIDDPVLAVSQVRRTITDVVHCWASSHKHILHALGGLDSSIVCTCLATAPSRPRVTCYTYHSQGAESDERIFARSVAARAGVELIEVERTPAWDLEPLLDSMRRSPTFNNHVSYVEPAFVEGNLARLSGATAITSGFGGDQLFVQSYANSAVDYATRHGMGRVCWSFALDDACMESRSFWTIMWEVIRAVVFGRFADPRQPALDGTRALIPEHILSTAKQSVQALHPHIRRWITERASRRQGRLAVASGKVLQIQQLMYPPHMRNPLGGVNDLVRIAPLLSQPVLELCLRIPTWVHTSAGQDRVIARRAFRDLLPPEVASRWTKGGWEEQAAGLLNHNIRFVRGLLIDGELMRRNLLIRSRVEEWLSYRPTRLVVSNPELFHIIFAEAWLRAVRPLGGQVSR